jgi:cytoskeletal protein CcmA (bactofilin family)
MTAYKIKGSADVSPFYDKDLTVKGSVNTAKDLTVDGRLKVNGKFRGHKIIAQSIELKGSIKADDIVTTKLTGKGSLECEDIEVDSDSPSSESPIPQRPGITEQISIRGKVNANGLEAKQVEIVLDGSDSNISRIKAEIVSISAEDVKSSIVVDTIEGKTVDVSKAKVREIVGDNVIVGAGCEIDHVAYSRSIEVSPDSTVKSQTNRS